MVLKLLQKLLIAVGVFTIILTVSATSFAQQGGCVYRLVGNSYLCVAIPGASSSQPPIVPDNTAVSDGSTTYYGDGFIITTPVPGVTYVPGYQVTPVPITTQSPSQSPATSPSPSKSPTPSTTPKSYASIHYIYCPQNKQLTDNVRIIYNFLDDNNRACNVFPGSSTYFQSLPFSFGIPFDDSSKANCTPTKLSFYYVGIPSNSLYTPNSVEGNGATITNSADGHKTVLIPITSLSTTNPVKVYINASDAACNTTANPYTGAGNTGGGTNTGITGGNGTTCDPVEDGKIDENDFKVWKQEYLHSISTTRSACMSPNKTVDLLGFQAWKNIFILKTKTTFP